jgi:hypothetical protein
MSCAPALAAVRQRHALNQIRFVLFMSFTVLVRSACPIPYREIIPLDKLPGFPESAPRASQRTASLKSAISGDYAAIFCKNVCIFPFQPII